MTKAEEIKMYMEKLDITKEEATQLWEDDHSDEVLPEVAEMEKKAKQIKRYEKSNNKRKTSTKERKIDTEKKSFLEGFRIFVEGKGGTITAKKNEAEFSFTYGGNAYTVKLIKHRPQRKKVTNNEKVF